MPPSIAAVSGTGDPIAAFNQVLSEVLDVVMVASQADRKVPPSHTLHGELDRLVDDLRGWAQRLMAEDDALGVSALTFMPSRAGRQMPNPWPGAPSDDEVRRLLGDLLGRLDRHLEAARAQQCDDGTAAVLAEVDLGLHGHRQALRLD
jgi:hypothetical protein